MDRIVNKSTLTLHQLLPIPSYFGQSPFSYQHLDWVLATVQETKDRITAIISSSKRTLPADISTLILPSPEAVPGAQKSSPVMIQEILAGDQDGERTPALNKFPEGSKEPKSGKKRGSEDHEACSAAKKPCLKTGKPPLQA
ncbi:hypothetical protein PAXRUDRAFT_20066 [Paxillus rubicundulus Ve08.2h10]|uniref:Uncharacterized protein n=1 Tax=Paxillus rubicundulus Ve08.2h10 TaxID=930991 RepID=A0A0D0DAJ8_9AGAM|nr:hypothetical protein PAXRUDRAFT_20066 [Paxillus rubicundulus Ve08.2h10]